MNSLGLLKIALLLSATATLPAGATRNGAAKGAPRAEHTSSSSAVPSTPSIPGSVAQVATDLPYGSYALNGDGTRAPLLDDAMCSTIVPAADDPNALQLDPQCL